MALGKRVLRVVETACGDIRGMIESAEQLLSWEESWEEQDGGLNIC